MTADELRYKAFKLSKAVGLNGYFYTPDQMQEFIDQLCKEQRGKCQNEFNKMTSSTYPELSLRILNAPKPDGI